MVVKLDEGLFVDKNKILEDLAVAHRDGGFSDITFTMSDNIEISTNKFMLGCRSPFFASMLFGGLKNKIADKVRLQCCDSETMRKVLEFIWCGTVKFSDMDTQSLLNLLETSRMMCLDSLHQGVNDYLENLVTTKKVDMDDCLVAFDFAISHKFESLSECLLKHIDQNIQKVRMVPKFRKLSGISVLEILRHRNRKAKSIDLFMAFTTWIEENDHVPENIKIQMINSFELKSFSRSEIQNVVRKTGFYKNKAIFDALQEKYDELEEALLLQMNQLELKEQQLAYKSNQLSDEAERTAKLKQKLEEDPNMCLIKNGGRLLHQRMYLPDYLNNYLTNNKVVFEFQDTELINKVEFTLSYDDQKYTIESSLDGRHWTQLADFSDNKCTGRQVVYFRKTKMRYLAILLNYEYMYRNYNWINVKNGSIVAMLDTNTIVRRNWGQEYRYRSLFTKR